MAATKRRLQKGSPEAVGAAYADDQVSSKHFADWLREQLIDASQMNPDHVLSLENLDEARVVARNSLQQLEWDAQRDLDSREIHRMLAANDVRADRDGVIGFWRGFSRFLRNSNGVDQLADDLLRMQKDIGKRGRRRAGEPHRGVGVHAAKKRPKAPGSRSVRSSTPKTSKRGV